MTERTDGTGGSVDTTMGAAIGPYWKSWLSNFFLIGTTTTSGRAKLVEILNESRGNRFPPSTGYTVCNWYTVCEC